MKKEAESRQLQLKVSFKDEFKESPNQPQVTSSGQTPTHQSNNFPSSKQLLQKINNILDDQFKEPKKNSMKSIDALSVSVDFKCKCRKTKCLKMYCECFAVGKLCNGCSCCDCWNLLDYQQQRANAIDEALERDPDVFKFPTQQKKGGCICKKTECLKKYCECFSSGFPCTQQCKCINCNNKM